MTPPIELQQGQHFEIITTTSDETENEIKNHNDRAIITKVQIEPTTVSTAMTTATTTACLAQPREIVSYQRFGRIDKKTTSYPFKCHLCGFSCRFKESLLFHFKQVHPY